MAIGGATSKTGKFRFRTAWRLTPELTADEFAYASKNGAPFVTFKRDDSSSVYLGSDAINVGTASTGTERTNWNGFQFGLGEWVETTAFSVSDYNFTYKHIIMTTIIIIVVAVIVGLICMYISWRNRKAIAAGARRASQAIVRASVRLRASITGNPVPPEDDGPPPDPNALGGDKNEKKFLKDMFDDQEGGNQKVQPAE